MGNKNAKKINQDAEDEGRRINREGDRFNDYAYGRLPEAKQRGDQLWNKQFGTYNDILDNKYAGRSVERGAGMGGGGDLRQYEDFFRNFGGGVDAAGQNRIRGLGVFDEYAKTGGFNEAQKTDFRNRATGTVPRFYDAIQQDLDRMKGVQGGYSPGFDAQAAKIAREKTQAGQEATLAAETDLKSIIDKNRQWGSGMASSSEQGLQELLTRNKLGSMGSAAGLAQARGDMDFRDAQAQREDDYRWTFGALGGMQDMYTSAPGEEGMFMDQINQGRQIRGNQQGANLDRRMQYNPNRSTWDQVTSGIKDVAGIAAPFFGGFGGSPFGGFGGGGGGYASTQGGGYGDARTGQPQDFMRYTQGPQINNPFNQYQRGFGTQVPQKPNPFRRY